jgi:hypothetical protein
MAVWKRLRRLRLHVVVHAADLNLTRRPHRHKRRDLTVGRGDLRAWTLTLFICHFVYFIRIITNEIY